MNKAMVKSQQEQNKNDALELKLYIPLKVNQYLVETDDTKQVDGSQYFNEIREAIKEETKEYGKKGLAKDLKNNKIRNKIYSIKPQIEIVNDVLMGAAIVKMAKPLTDAEIAELKDFVEESMSTGWGDEFANRIIDIEGGHLRINFWDSENYRILTEDEFEAANQCVEQTMM